ncbi:MAG TPA: 23S rRNA (guanosine(2251)-2'-O)-methyltransferase RlmB [Acidimicrobiales bacterium]|nr:23S rRNA (guanosine(2251)-2'-O)-methyltransferase RlmB [Acidimicrobiales bacterium]
MTPSARPSRSKRPPPKAWVPSAAAKESLCGPSPSWPVPRPRGPRPSGAARRRDGGPPPPRPRRSPDSPGRRPLPRHEGDTLGGTHVAGRHAVRELLSTGGREVKEILVAEHLGASDVVDEILELARRGSVPVRETNRAALGRLAGLDVHQGVLAIAEPLRARELDDLAKPGDGGPATLVALDGVTDPHNVGAVLRSAESAGATGGVLARHGGPPVTATVAKAAAGAIEHLPLASVARIPAALERLRASGLWIVGLDADGDSPLFGLELLTEPVVLVLGAEGAGLSRLSRERCDVVASIPRKGQTASLNVSAAAALACYEVLRVRGD